MVASYTAVVSLDDALTRLRSSFSDLDSLLVDRRVLDFGCGIGLQALTYFIAIHAWHHNVKEDDIRLNFPDDFERDVAAEPPTGNVLRPRLRVVELDELDLEPVGTLCGVYSNSGTMPGEEDASYLRSSDGVFTDFYGNDRPLSGPWSAGAVGPACDSDDDDDDGGGGTIGDIDADGTVGVNDLVIMVSVWGEPDDAADLNEDGLVNNPDFGMSGPRTEHTHREVGFVSARWQRRSNGGQVGFTQ